MTQEEVLNKAWVETINTLQKDKWTNLAGIKRTLDGLATELKGMVTKVVNATQATEYERFTELAQLIYNIKDFATKAGLTLSAEIEETIADAYKTSYYRTAWQLDNATPNNVEIVFGKLSDLQVRAAILTPFQGGMFSDRLFQISNQMAYNIQEEVTKGIIIGRPIGDTADEIYDLFGKEGEGYQWRAELIARTETIRAREIARQSLFDDNRNLIENEEWINMESACDECQDLADEFNAGNHDLQPILDSHPNCVCTIRAIMKDWKELGGSSDEEPDLMDYEDWVQEKGIDE